jgi:hypothetical protein
VFPSINRKVAWAGGAIGVLLLGAAGGIAFLPDGQAQSVPAGQMPIVNQGPGSAYSFGQQGSITAGTVNIAPPKRELSDPKALTLKNKMLTELSRDKPITVTALIGDAESIQFAQEIHEFLKQNGFRMKEPNGISQAIFAGAPKGIIFSDRTQRRTECHSGGRTMSRVIGWLVTFCAWIPRSGSQRRRLALDGAAERSSPRACFRRFDVAQFFAFV